MSEESSVLSGSVIYDHLTSMTEESAATQHLLQTVLHAWLVAIGPRVIDEACALIERATNTYHATHIDAADGDLAIFERWVDHRRWLQDEVSAAAASAGLDNQSCAALSALRKRTNEIASLATDRRF